LQNEAQQVVVVNAEQTEMPMEGIGDTGEQMIMVVIGAEEMEMEVCEVQPLDPDVVPPSDPEFVKGCAELSPPPINICEEHSYSTT
jgi:hypothetical protein